MIVKVKAMIAVEVRDEAQAEEACAALDMGLDAKISQGFPHGEIIAADIDGYDVVTDEEIAERGWSE